MVRTRMAPSPTGEYHIGHIRTILFNYAWAKKNSGQFIIRIEDTDRERYVEGATERILNDIRDYGFSWDEGPEVGGPHEPYFQSQRLDIYKRHALELVDKGQAYYCFCSKSRLEELKKQKLANNQLPGYDRHCRSLASQEVENKLSEQIPFVIRLKVPDNQDIVFTDTVVGEVHFNTSAVDDQVLLKSDGFPTYHLAVVVDDQIMGITHVIRGNEWISSTPKHILLARAFGWDTPSYSHVPVFLDPGGEGKMSKRKGSVSARSFLNDGYLPEAMDNYLMLLGWNPGSDQEIFSLGEFVQKFDIKDINKSNPRFTYDKLNWFNQYYIRTKPDADLLEILRPFVTYQASDELLLKIIPLVKERITTLKEFSPLTEFFVTAPRSAGRPTNPEHLALAKDILSSADWTKEGIEAPLVAAIKASGWKVGDFFMTLRLAICGTKITPPLTESMLILGRDEVLSRISNQ